MNMTPLWLLICGWCLFAAVIYTWDVMRKRGVRNARRGWK